MKQSFSRRFLVLMIVSLPIFGISVMEDGRVYHITPNHQVKTSEEGQRGGIEHFGPLSSRIDHHSLQMPLHVDNTEEIEDKENPRVVIEGEGGRIAAMERGIGRGKEAREESGAGAAGSSPLSSNPAPSLPTATVTTNSVVYEIPFVYPLSVGLVPASEEDLRTLAKYAAYRLNQPRFVAPVDENPLRAEESAGRASSAGEGASQSFSSSSSSFPTIPSSSGPSSTPYEPNINPASSLSASQRSSSSFPFQSSSGSFLDSPSSSPSPSTSPQGAFLPPGVAVNQSIFDDKNIASVAVRAGIDIVNDHNDAICVVGALTSSMSLNLENVFATFGLPMLSPSASTPTLSNETLYPTFSRIIAPSDKEAEVMIDLCLRYNWTKVYIISSTDEFSSTLTGAFEDLAMANKIIIDVHVVVPPGLPVYDDDLTDLVEAKPRILFLLIGLDSLVSMIGSMFRVGIHPAATIASDIVVTTDTRAYTSPAGAPDNFMDGWVTVGQPIGTGKPWQDFLAELSSLSNDTWPNLYRTITNTPRLAAIMEAYEVLANAIRTCINGPPSSASYASSTTLSSPSSSSSSPPPPPPPLDHFPPHDYASSQPSPSSSPNFPHSPSYSQSSQPFPPSSPSPPSSYPSSSLPPYPSYISRPTFVCDPRNHSQFLAALRSTNTSTISGSIAFNGKGDRPPVFEVFNVRHHNLTHVGRWEAPGGFVVLNTIVWPDGNTTAPIAVLPPTLTWLSWSSGEGLTLVSLAFGGICLALFTIPLIFFYRKTPIIHSSTWPLLIITLVGLIMGFVSALMWVGKPNPVICHLRFWLVPLALVITFSPLVAKMWRIMRIFRRPLSRGGGARNFKYPLKELILIIVIITGIQIAICITWSIVGSGAILLVPDQNDPSKAWVTCSRSHRNDIFAYVVYGYLGLLVLVGAYFAFRARHAWKLWNESAWLGRTIYNLVFFAVLAIVLAYSLHNFPLAVAILIVVFILEICYVTYAMTFGPKLWVLWRHPDQRKPGVAGITGVGAVGVGLARGVGRAGGAGAGTGAGGTGGTGANQQKDAAISSASLPSSAASPSPSISPGGEGSAAILFGASRVRPKAGKESAGSSEEEVGGRVAKGAGSSGTSSGSSTSIHFERDKILRAQAMAQQQEHGGEEDEEQEQEKARASHPSTSHARHHDHHDHPYPTSPFDPYNPSRPVHAASTSSRTALGRSSSSSFSSRYHPPPPHSPPFSPSSSSPGAYAMRPESLNATSTSTGESSYSSSRDHRSRPSLHHRSASSSSSYDDSHTTRYDGDRRV